MVVLLSIDFHKLYFRTAVLGAWRPTWLVPAGAGRWLSLPAGGCWLPTGRWPPWQLIGDCCSAVLLSFIMLLLHL
jgi:hypothetical protein